VTEWNVSKMDNWTLAQTSRLLSTSNKRQPFLQVLIVSDSDQRSDFTDSRLPLNIRSAGVDGLDPSWTILISPD
jgi:hypothetical protein